MGGDKIIVGAGSIVFNEEEEVLLVQSIPEKKDYWHGKWTFPGGKVRYGESIEEAAVRETKEETNLDVKVISHASTSDRIVKEGSATVLHVIYIVFFMEVLGGNLRPGDDVGITQWFSKDRLTNEIGDLHKDTIRILDDIGRLRPIS